MALLANPRRASVPGPLEPGYDFGLVLAHGQDLRHEFTLINPTDRPVRLLKAEAFTPCCSAIGSLPESIPPGGMVKIPVIFKPGLQTGHKRVDFAVYTGDAEHPVWPLSVAAALLAEMEIRRDGGSAASLPMGRSGRLLFTVVCRRVGHEGRGAPESITAAPPLMAAFVGTPQERRLPNDVIESTCEVKVALPATPEQGARRGEIRFLWPGGQTHEQLIDWQVTPQIRASPSGIVLKAGAGKRTQTVLLQSGDRPFRILEISGSLLTGSLDPPAASTRSHALHLVLDPERADLEGVTDIRIKTDHPDQAIISLSVLVLPPEREGAG